MCVRTCVRERDLEVAGEIELGEGANAKWELI